MFWRFLTILGLALVLTTCGKTKKSSNGEASGVADNPDLRAQCASEGKLLAADANSCVPAEIITTGCGITELEQAFPDFNWTPVRSKYPAAEEGFEVKECGINNDLSRFGPTLLVNFLQTTAEGTSLVQQSFLLEYKPAAIAQSVATQLAGKQLAVTTNTEIATSFVQKDCYEIGELPGTCQHWSILSNGLGTGKKPHDCALIPNQSGVVLTCADTSQAPCQEFNTIKQLEAITLSAPVSATISQISSSVNTWKFSKTACQDTPPTFDAIRQKITGKDLLVSKTASSFTSQQCIRFAGAVPGSCEIFGFNNINDGQPLPVENCDITLSGLGTLTVDCPEEADCQEKGVDGSLILASGLYSWPFEDQNATTLTNEDGSVTVTIGAGLCTLEN